jgi:hypothetical protein
MKYEKKIKEMLKGSEDTFLLVTKNGSATVGYGHEILTLLTMLVRDVRKVEGITSEMIEEAFRISSMSEKELARDVLEKLKEMLEKGE